MIDISQLTSLVSAFRVETEKESISPETVDKLLQDILDLLATASSDTERKILDDWKALRSQYTVVYDVAHATGMADMEHMFLTLKGRSLRNGAFNIFCEWKSVLESTHDKQELREAANTFNVIVKNKDDIAAIVTQAMEMMAKKQELERDRKSREEGLESSE